MFAQSRPEGRLSVRGLRSRGVVTLPEPPALKQAVAEVIPIWKAFCALPMEIKKQFIYTKDLKVSGVGYEAPEEGRDPKEDFHLRKTEEDWLLELAESIGDPTARTFVTAVMELADKVESCSLNFAEVVAEEFEDSGFLADVKERLANRLFRFLHYLPGGKAGSPIAEPHVDKGGFTAKLFEDLPGLEILTPEMEWEPLPVPMGEMPFIGGMRLQHRLRGAMNAACHRVVATPESVEHGRYSAVCFHEFSGSPYYDKERWGRLQAFRRGFFYGMPHEKFDRYFTS